MLASASPLLESSKGAHDVPGVKYWVCSEKRAGINLVASFGENRVQLTLPTVRVARQQLPNVIPRWGVRQIAGRGALGVKTVFSLKPFKTTGRASWFSCRSSRFPAGTEPPAEGRVLQRTIL